jgi:hypothetical protein
LERNIGMPPPLTDRQTVLLRLLGRLEEVIADAVEVLPEAEDALMEAHRIIADAIPPDAPTH